MHISDPDHQRLLDLISMLPGPDNRIFWEQFAEANDTSVGYIYEKMSQISMGPAQVTSFCLYMMIFFGGDKPDLWAVVGRELFAVGSDDDHLGRRYCEEVMSAAWATWASRTSRKGTTSPSQWAYPSALHHLT